MFRKISAILVLCALVLSLSACGGGNDSSASTSGTSSEADTSQQEESSVPESDISSVVEEEDDGVYYDLEAVYDAIIETQPDGAQLPPMMRVTDMKVISELYDGVEKIDTKQIVLYVSENMSVPCEIMLVETARRNDAETISDIFLDRIDEGAGNEENPDAAIRWANKAQLQEEGRFIAMVMLPEGCEVPSNVFWLLNE
ncbi:MAG: DUF4358 domain-containing protein [Oscillospiraceae bacterium]|nr:DUF4358 domain-containing protein [Oscillospiraceae bacterium]